MINCIKSLVDKTLPWGQPSREWSYAFNTG